MAQHYYAPPTVDTDEQTLTLTGNTLVLGGGTGGGGSIDLTPFLDNTDDQTITQFVLSPAGVLTLTIEDGNTVAVDLSSLDTDTDDQTLALAGTLLTIADGNTVDLVAIADTDISAVDLAFNAATNELTVSVTEDGTTLSDTEVIPLEDSPFRVDGTTTPATDANHNDDIYHTGDVAVGRQNNNSAALEVSDAQNGNGGIHIDSASNTREALTIRRTDNANDVGIAFQNSGNAHGGAIYLRPNADPSGVSTNGITIAAGGNETSADDLQDTVTFKDNGEVRFHSYGDGSEVEAGYSYIAGFMPDGDVVEIDPAAFANTDDQQLRLSQTDDYHLAIEIEDGNTVEFKLDIERLPLYEYHTYWAEDSGNAADNGWLLSWGNGDVGLVGVPIGNNNELIAMGIHADNTSSANDDLQADLYDIQNAAAPVFIARVEFVNVGDGQDDNAHVYTDLRGAPVAIPDGAVLAWRLGNENGAVSSYRVYAETRKDTGNTYVSDVKIVI